MANAEQKNAVLDFVLEWNNDLPHFCVYTSGSTGKPKAVLLSKIAAVYAAQASNAFFSLPGNARFISCMDPSTIGQKMLLVRSALLGGSVLFYPNKRIPFDVLPPDADFISLVPLQLEALLTHVPEWLSCFKRILVGGAPIGQGLKNEILKRGLPVWESYGMTETYSHVGLRRVGEDLFSAIPGIQFSTDDQRLVIDAPALGLHQLLTNDLVKISADGTQFEWLGRADWAINSGGYKFIPEVLETKIADVIAFPYFILGEDDDEFGQVVTLYLETGYQTVDTALLLDRLKDYVNRYELPKKIYCCPRFERFENGKLDRLNTQLSAIERTK